MMVGFYFFFFIEVSSVLFLEFIDLDVDWQLFVLEGVLLLVFISEGCVLCCWVWCYFFVMDLFIECLCWVDVGCNGGLVECYGVFYLLVLFMVCDGCFYGVLNVLLYQEVLWGVVLVGLIVLFEELF